MSTLAEVVKYARQGDVAAEFNSPTVFSSKLKTIPTEITGALANIVFKHACTNVADSAGITYNTTTGDFTISSDGYYRVSASLSPYTNDTDGLKYVQFMLRHSNNGSDAIVFTDATGANFTEGLPGGLGHISYQDTADTYDNVGFSGVCYLDATKTYQFCANAATITGGKYVRATMGNFSITKL